MAPGRPVSSWSRAPTRVLLRTVYRDRRETRRRPAGPECTCVPVSRVACVAVLGGLMELSQNVPLSRREIVQETRA
eukprot:2698284-Prymnesium_polylepis.1